MKNVKDLTVMILIGIISVLVVMSVVAYITNPLDDKMIIQYDTGDVNHRYAVVALSKEGYYIIDEIVNGNYGVENRHDLPNMITFEDAVITTFYICENELISDEDKWITIGYLRYLYDV